MKAAFWALGVGPLLLTLWAAPVGKFLFPSSTETSGGSGSVDAETLSVRLPCYDQPPGPHSVQRWVGHSGTQGYVDAKVWTPGDSCPYTEQVQPQGEHKASCPLPRAQGVGRARAWMK